MPVPGEFDLIAWIRKKPQQLPSTLVQAIGDDCAVFRCSAPANWAVTTDLLFEDIHFRRRWISPELLGRKSLAVNLSDLAAMGATPFACLLGLGLPAELRHDYFESLVRGFLRHAQDWSSPLVGGDLSQAAKLSVAVTAWGSLPEGVPLLCRSGARPGDRVVLVGEIGYSRLGLEILRREDPSEVGQLADEAALADWAADPFRLHCLRAHLLPVPLFQVGSWLAENRLAHALIDVSDGLAADLQHLARESGVRAEIDVKHLPLPEQGIGELAPLEAALNGGEDYALLLTASSEQLNRLQSAYPRTFPGYRVIGNIREGAPGVYLKENQKRRAYHPGGFDHFR